jgi:hypothetical protein
VEAKMPYLVRLSYHSDIIDGHEDTFDEIMSEALLYNLRHDITGCLLRHDGQYFQFIEGSRELVLDLFERIKADPRHGDVQLDRLVPIDTRLFKRWSMATLSEADTASIATSVCEAKNLFDGKGHDVVLALAAGVLQKREASANLYARANDSVESLQD